MADRALPLRLPRFARGHRVLYGAEVVHYDHVSRPEGRAEHVVEIGEEDFGVRSCFHRHRRDQSAHAHRTQDREDLPVAFGRRFRDTYASSGTTVASCHLGRDAAFIKEDKTLGIDPTQPLYEHFAPKMVRFGVPLGGVERLFFTRKPSSPTIFHRCGVLTSTPVEAFNSARTSRRYRSGFANRMARTASRSTRAFGPGR